MPIKKPKIDPNDKGLQELLKNQEPSTRTSAQDHYTHTGKGCKFA